MDNESFNEGIRHLEIMTGAKLQGERKVLYHKSLENIPNDLWHAGIPRLASTYRYATFPPVAEIGEACVPGEAEREEVDPWTGRWTKKQAPWTERLAALIQPALEPPSSPLQIPGPRDPLSESERTLLGKPDFAGLLIDIEEKVKNAEAKRRAHRETRGQHETTSPYLRAGHVRNLVSTHSQESQAVRDYWTPERTAERKAFLHRQLAWIGRRDEAERTGQEFGEMLPE